MTKRPVKCGRCKGTGVVDVFGSTCPTCGGVGKIRI